MWTTKITISSRFSTQFSTQGVPDKEQENQKITLTDHENAMYEGRLQIKDHIGTSSKGQIPVFRSEYNSQASILGNHQENSHTEGVLVAVKIVRMDEDKRSHHILMDEVHNSNLIPHHGSLIGINKKPFQDGHFYCVLLPAMEKGSLRSIMSRYCPEGFSVDTIVLVLKEILTALSVIHGEGALHKQIHAGHIFVNEKREIKLAYSASVFDENGQDETAAEICE